MAPAAEQTALAFANALAQGEFASAHSMLAKELQGKLSAGSLRWKYKLMTFFPMLLGGGGGKVECEVFERLDDWPTKQPGDLGWFYVSISNGKSWAEAVTTTVCREDGGPRIRDIEWGRP